MENNLYVIKITGKNYLVFGIGKTDLLYGEKLKMNPYVHYPRARKDFRNRHYKVKQ